YDGIGVCLKHFWGNEQEDNRDALNNVIGERAAREIYLKQFEIAVRLAQPQTMMNCYNENNGWPGSDSWDCNEDVLRGEWGFKGYVMTDWGGGQSTAFVAKHGGCDMVMPGGDANVILSGYAAYDPANPEADLYNKICLGDIQKSALRILQVDLLSQDMEKIMADLGEEYTAGSYSANNNAPLATGYAPVEKSEVSNVGIVAEKVTADSKVDKTVEAKVVYNGEADLTTVRLIVKCDVPIESVEALGDNSIEFNPANGKVIVYAADGSAIADELFKINFKIDKWYKSGEYPIDLSLIEATDAEVEDVDAVVVDGAIIFDNTPLKGDVDDDGIICNKDLILIARYLVKLIDFNEKQKIAADYNENGEINNADLILIARHIVGDCPPEYAE
ncbi:MAG: hypothetical protein IJL71_01955, partial [Oscillospiraceae bacterium]|nr:hypothetical protein [Oscillospiraceae bacterium]